MTKVSLFSFLLEVLTNLPHGYEGRLQIETCGIPDVPNQEAAVFVPFQVPRTISVPTIGQSKGQSRKSLAFDTGDFNETTLKVWKQEAMII